MAGRVIPRSRDATAQARHSGDTGAVPCHATTCVFWHTQTHLAGKHVVQHVVGDVEQAKDGGPAQVGLDQLVAHLCEWKNERKETVGVVSARASPGWPSPHAGCA